MKKWKVCSHHLAYYEGSGTIHHPSAIDIFGFQQDEGFKDMVSFELGLSFSRLCAKLECQVSFDEERTNIVLGIFGIHKNTRTPVDFDGGRIIDHIIINGRWMYLGDVVYVLNDILDKSGIHQSGVISFDSYLALRRRLSLIEGLRFVDTVECKDILKISKINPTVPESLNAKLFPYQQEGFEWMVRTLDIAHGFLLGDEMGLGKTLQIISLLQYYAEKKDIHALIIAPVSLLVNWSREIDKFAPLLSHMIHSGSLRAGLYKDLLKVNVVITSYGTAVRDLLMMKMIDWDFLILDEGQNIKNPISEKAIQIKKIPRKNSIVMSGTPFENHLTDIWSIFDFIHPALFDDLQTFNEMYKDDVLDAKRIEPIISPFMIRRRIADVRKDLPDKIVDNQELLMNDDEALLYEQIRNSSSDGNDNMGVLTRLRMLCAHPFLIEDTIPWHEDFAEYSAKYQRFLELVEEIIANDEKLIVFTTFRKMNEMIVKDLRIRYGLYTASIDGSTVDRQKVVDEFSVQKKSAVLVVNPKAGGAGLNITAATHVIHYNLEWNPAVEGQASARAYRTGQDHTVVIHRLFYSDTIEEYINDLMEKKTEIGDAAVIGTKGNEDIKIDLLQALMKTPGGKYR